MLRASSTPVSRVTVSSTETGLSLVTMADSLSLVVG
jgi:hypothetical protein